MTGIVHKYQMLLTGIVLNINFIRNCSTQCAVLSLYTNNYFFGFKVHKLCLFSLESQYRKGNYVDIQIAIPYSTS